MTWEEFCEKAIKNGAVKMNRVFKDKYKEKIIFRNVVFYGQGTVHYLKGDTICEAFTQDRTPDQMDKIREALQ